MSLTYFIFNFILCIPTLSLSNYSITVGNLNFILVFSSEVN